MDSGSIFSDFLSQLGVRHTREYSDRAFAGMSFKSLFGLSKLLQSYGIANEAYRLVDKQEMRRLPTPFIAKTGGGSVIVTDMGTDRISYLSQGQYESMPTADFIEAFDGIVLLAFPDDDSGEPEYVAHERALYIDKGRKWILALGMLALFLYCFITNRLYAQWSTVCVAFFDILGLWLTYMLVQKSVKIKNAAADKVCGVLQAGGCDSVLKMKASKFFGIFGWSEVGFAYFSVSLLCLLMFPGWIRYLAACNVCCLPFTFWSIWYQKYRAKVWCTLCVSVQCTLWLLFFSYLFGGWLQGVFPLRIEFFVLGTTYVTVLFGLNRLLPLIEHEDDNDNTTADSSSTTT